MEGELLLPLYLYRFIRLDFVTINLVVILDYTIIILGGLNVIDYSPFWETLEKSIENWYTLTKNHRISDSTLNRLKHNRDVTTKTLNDLCRILGCDIKDIVRYIPSDKDQKL